MEGATWSLELDSNLTVSVTTIRQVSKGTLSSVAEENPSHSVSNEIYRQVRESFTKYSLWGTLIFNIVVLDLEHAWADAKPCSEADQNRIMPLKTCPSQRKKALSPVASRLEARGVDGPRTSLCPHEEEEGTCTADGIAFMQPGLLGLHLFSLHWEGTSIMDRLFIC